jgi:hypothetical protein
MGALSYLSLFPFLFGRSHRPQMLRRTPQSFARLTKVGGELPSVVYKSETKVVDKIVPGRRTFAQSAARSSYEDTIPNLRIHKDTKVICQGFTGKTVRILYCVCSA